MSNQPENNRELQAMNIDVHARSRTLALENTVDVNDGRELIIINDIYERSGVVIRNVHVIEKHFNLPLSVCLVIF